VDRDKGRGRGFSRCHLEYGTSTVFAILRLVALHMLYVCYV
jgi:hypothetical protein